MKTCTALLPVLLLNACAFAVPAPQGPPPTMASVLEQAQPADWRTPDPRYTVYLELDNGRVVIELAQDFAPLHSDNIRTLATEGYFDGLAILRVQENYVVQWGDPDEQRGLGSAQETLPPEFDRASDDLPFTVLPDGDVYAPQVGLSKGFPVGRDPDTGRSWLAHCYGMVGVGRGMAPESNGTSLYVVIGHAPRHLDRNITLVGRVLQGMELLTTLPRGTGALGFYEQPEQRVAVKGMAVAAELPVDQRTAIEVLRSDTATFEQLIAARRNRHEDWFLQPVGRLELCNVPVVVRSPPA